MTCTVDALGSSHIPGICWLKFFTDQEKYFSSVHPQPISSLIVFSQRGKNQLIP
jgi:hypothetical protein